MLDTTAARFPKGSSFLKDGPFVSVSERAPKNSGGLPGGRVHVIASIIEEIELFRGNIRVTAWNENEG